MRPLPRLLVILATVLSMWSASGGRAEATSITLQTPTGLNPGDTFRFVFATDGIRDATSTNITDYDGFVNAQAGAATYAGAVVNWLVIGSTDSVDAIDHVGQSTDPVYLSDGTLVTLTTTSAGLWSGALVHAINLDLATSPVLTFAWTGTNPTGTGFGGALGTPTPQVGSTIDSDADWIASGRSNSGDSRPLYGISTVLTVPQSSVPVPEPSTLALLGTAMCVVLFVGWHRRQVLRVARPADCSRRA